jgi:aminomethyltransferase
MSPSDLKRTPLHAEHVAAGARLVPFAGWEMPVHYPSGITAEHHAVRNAAGLFDVSHMGELEIHGERALDFVQYVTSNDAAKLAVGQAQYSTLLKDDGTLLDDLLVYRLDDRLMLVVNAANRERDLAWLRGFAGDFGVEIRDRSEEIALLALQGPHAAKILRPLTHADLQGLRYYRFLKGDVAGAPAVISRTGYTGEDGFELYLDADVAVQVWRRLLEVGGGSGLLPAGLGARDSLRLEMGYALYGIDLDEWHTPLEAGLGWVVKLNKGEFVGRDALLAKQQQGVRQRLSGFRLRERGFPRPGYDLLVDDRAVGSVTSGVLSPSLGVGIGLGYLPADQAVPGREIAVRIRDRVVAAAVVRPPFYTEGSIKP